MNKTILKVYTAAIHEAAMSRQAALEIELAVGFAVILDCGPKAKRLARETLLTIYHGAGSQCSQPGDLDWKAINRRITASIALFEFVGVDTVREWAGEATKADLIAALRKHIQPLKLKSVNEVLLACDKIKAPRSSKSRDVANVPGTAEIATEHVRVVVPPTATREELIDLATRLMMMAQARFEQPAQAAAVDHEAMTGEHA